MAAPGRTLTIYLATDTKNAIKGTNQFGKTLQNFAKVGALAAAAAVALLTKAMVDYAAEAVDLAREQRKIVDGLTNVMRQMGYTEGAYAGATDRILAYSSALQAQIAVSDETIRGVQTTLATFGELGKTVDEAGGAFDRATVAAFDLASAGFGTAESNAIQLGKALNDPIKGLTALARSGVTFTEAEKERIKTLVESGKIGEAQVLILEAIEKQVGGTAEATATAADKMALAWGDIQENVGDALLPAVDEIQRVMIEDVIPAVSKLVTKALPYVEDFAKGAAEAFGDFTDELAAWDNTKTMDQIKGIATELGVVGDAWSDLYDTITGTESDAAAKKQHSLISIMENYFSVMSKVVSYYTTVWTWTLKAANGLYKLIFAVKDAVESFLKWGDELDKRFETAWQDIGAAIVDGLRNGLGPLDGIIAGAVKAVSSLPDAVKTVLGIRSPSRVFIDIGGDIVKGFEIGLSGLKTVTDKTAEAFKDMTAKSNAYLDEWLTDAKDRQDKALAAWQDFRDSVQTEISGSISLTDAIREDDWQAAWDKQIADAKEWAGNLQNLAANPYITDALIQQLQALGPEAGNAFVKDLTPAMIDKMNADLMAVDILAQGAGEAMADRFYLQGIQDAEAHMAGYADQVEKQLDKLYKLGKKMGTAVSDGFNSATRSLPSQAATGYGASTMAAPTVNVTVQAGIGDPVAIAKTIERTLATARLRTGRAF